MSRHGWSIAFAFALVWLVVAALPLTFYRAAPNLQSAFPWLESFWFQDAALAVAIAVSQLVYRRGLSAFGYLQAVGAGARLTLICALGMGLFIVVNNSVAGGTAPLFRDPATDTVAASLALITAVAGIVESLVISAFTRKT